MYIFSCPFCLQTINVFISPTFLQQDKMLRCMEELKTQMIMLRQQQVSICYLGRVKRIWYLSPMRAAKVQASLRIRPVSPEPSLLAHTSSESRGTFRQKARSLAPLNGWACAVKIGHDGMLEDTNSLDGAHLIILCFCIAALDFFFFYLVSIAELIFWGFNKLNFSLPTTFFNYIYAAKKKKKKARNIQLVISSLIDNFLTEVHIVFFLFLLL